MSIASLPVCKRRSHLKLIAAALTALTISTLASAEGCRLGRLVEFPITMVDLQPLMTAKINDVDVQFLLDSGAFYSMISGASAAQLKLKTVPVPFGFMVGGVKGMANVSITTVNNLVLAGAPLHNVEFLVGGSEVGQGSIGLLGQNFLHIADVEYDLGQGVVRLMKAQDCGKSMLGYWVGPSTPYSLLELSPEPPLVGETTGSRVRREMQLSRTISHALVNGTEIRVLFDSGSGTSILSLEAAARAGIKPDSPGVVGAGTSHGIGRQTFSTYIAPISSFKIGDEEIKNTRIRIGDVDLSDADMLIGADFFLSHRIYVANSQRKLYFTYNGGPVFNLTASTHPAAEPTTVAPTAQASSVTEDAADYARRGAAFASRREFDQALSALTRACELAPENPEYLYQRAMVYWEMRQPDSARPDLDRALIIKPDELRARIARAQLFVQSGDKTAAATDLDAADAIAAPAADERFEMALTYEHADRLVAAVGQLDLWIKTHPDDAKMPDALNARCWVRALSGTELPLALNDCSAALKRADKSSLFYGRVSDSRGLVYLRMGDYERSMADFDVSLKINAKNPWSLYGRGLDKLHKHDTAAGEADMAEASAIWPRVSDEFKRRGITP